MASRIPQVNDCGQANQTWFVPIIPIFFSAATVVQETCAGCRTSSSIEQPLNSANCIQVYGSTLFSYLLPWN
jgi:hypothetical protein